MSKTMNAGKKLDDFMVAGPASNDPAYLKWRDEKVREALAYANAHPEKMISEQDVWEKFGLKY